MYLNKKGEKNQLDPSAPEGFYLVEDGGNEEMDMIAGVVIE